MTRKNVSNHPNGLQIRQQIANLSARLMVDGYENDLNTACRKAAKQLGITDSRLWPDKEMLAASLHEYRAVFAPEHSQTQLQRLQNAQAFMMTIADVDPVVIGDILNGQASEHSAIDIAVDMEFEKQLVFHFTNRDLPYRYLPGKRIIMAVETGQEEYLIHLQSSPAMRQLRQEIPTRDQVLSMTIKQLEEYLTKMASS